MMVTANSFPVEVPTTPVARFFFSEQRGWGPPNPNPVCSTDTLPPRGASEKPRDRAEPSKNLGVDRPKTSGKPARSSRISPVFVSTRNACMRSLTDTPEPNSTPNLSNFRAGR